jgi:acetylornithine aminotransferase
MGRTGELFAYEHYGIEPDVMTLAKGLGSGFPIGAMLAKKEVAEYFKPGTHGSTFGGNPLATTAGIATVKQFLETDLLISAQNQMELLKNKLIKLQSEFPWIKTVRGVGFLLGLEIDGEADKVVKLAIKEKTLILTAGPRVIRILPPLIATEAEIDLFIARLKTVLAAYEHESSKISGAK